jgi:hypothetical protein
MDEYEEITMNSPKEETFPSCNATCGAHADVPDDPVRMCHDCQAGCTSRRTENSTEEEIGAGPYLLFAAILTILVSLAIKWLI